MHGNRKDGITVRTLANPSVSGNLIHSNGGQPLNVCDGGLGRFGLNDASQ